MKHQVVRRIINNYKPTEHTSSRGIKVVIVVLSAAIFSVVVVLLLQGAEAGTIIVDDDAPDGGDGSMEEPFNEIQDAVNASKDGDMIRVYEGIYYENVVVNKTVSLVGNGSIHTTIDGGGEGDVVNITANWVNISGFSVTSGNVSANSGIRIESDHNHIFENYFWNNGYGIHLYSSSDCKITNNTCSTNGMYGIFLDDSSGCEITNNTCSTNGMHGIFLDGSSGCEITNNTCSNNRMYGILLEDSSTCKITNNTCSNNDEYGILLEDSSACTITNNTCSFNNLVSDGCGIFLRTSDNCTLDYNTCENNVNGISFVDSDNCTITNNTCSFSDEYAITTTTSSDCNITNNTMIENDIIIYDFFYGNYNNWDSMNIDTTNTVNGKPVYYYYDATGFTVPNGAGQVILANCTWVRVENQNCSNIMVGLSSNITLENNTCSSNTEEGIYLLKSSNCTIVNNTCSWKDYGIYNYLSDNCNLMNNTCINNNRGIYLKVSSACTLENNTCDSNKMYGILLINSGDNILVNNTISDNGIGIHFEQSSQNNTANYNNICNNSEYGINATVNSGFSVTASNCWWGDNSGPYHPEYNSEGKGDNVTDYVEFDPWLIIHKTMYVYDNAPEGGNGTNKSPYTTIQEAVNNAEDGDTIHVWEGTYYENVVVNKTLSIIGNGSSLVTIDGGNESSVVLVTSDSCNISGLRLINSGYSTIYGGIEVHSDNNRIFDNICTGNRYGICLKNASNNIITGNNCSDNNYSDSNISSYRNSGIFMYAGSSNNTISGNNVSRNGNSGIFISDSRHNELMNNTLSSNLEQNIDLSDAPFSSLYGNLMTGSGITITGDNLEFWNTHYINISNLVNGKPVYYFKNGNYTEGNHTVPSGAGQVIIANCSHIVVENQNSENGFAGIMVAYSSHITLSNNSCPFTGEEGNLEASFHFWLWHTSDSTILDNHVNIVLGYSWNNTLENNNCSDTTAGIALIVSNGNTLVNNTCRNNEWWGFYLSNSNNNTLENNTCSGNVNGITLEYSNHNILTGNIITDNVIGIEYRTSSNSTAHFNTIFNNTEYGIDASFDNSYTMDATLNWWGSNFGPSPTKPERSPYGEGDNVTDNVEFDPWLGKNDRPVPEDLSTLYVLAAAPDDGNGSMERPFNRIQDALYHAQQGATIYVWEGLYRENVVADKTVSLIGNGSTATIINGSGTGDAILIIANDVNLTGFRLENTAKAMFEDLAGVRILSRNNSIFDNYMTCNSYGIRIFGNKAINNDITNNSCQYNRYGIHIFESGDNNLVNNNCSYNAWHGMVLKKSENNSVENCTFYYNGDTGIYANSDSNNNSITNNTCVGMDMWGIRLSANANHNIISKNRIEECSFGISISGSESNTIIDNLVFSGNTGIGLYDSSNNLIRTNTIDNHTFDGIRVNAHNNTITANHIRNSSQSGIHFISSKYNVVNYNLITENRIGISSENYVWEYDIHHNNIYSNIEYGLYADQDAEAVLNATLNWWGHESGPYHPIENPAGKGDNISKKVVFEPWLVKEQEQESEGNPPPVAQIDSITPNPAEERQTITFIGSGMGEGTIIRYSWRSGLDDLLYNGTNYSFSLTKLTSGTHTIFLRVQDNRGVWSVEVSATLTILPVSIANQPPQLIIQHPGNNTEVTGIITISGTVHDPEGDKTYVEISINGGEWLRINNATSWVFKYNTSQLEEGMNIIRIRASDGKNYSEILWLNLTVVHKQDNSDRSFPLPDPTQTAAGLVIISSFGLVGAFCLREDLRFAILSAIAIPLYTKLGREDILEQTNRRDIFTFLADNPGANYTRIKKELMLGTSTLVYHLNVLEREGLIHSRKEIGRRMFFLKQSETKAIGDSVEIPLSIIQKKIIDHLTINNNQTMREIEVALSLKQQTVSYNIRKLLERRVVIKSGGSRNAQYRIPEEYSVEDDMK